MKKNINSRLLFLIILCAGLLLPLTFVSADCPEEGLVPCGTPDCPCQLCHLFELLDNILRFVMFEVVPVLAGLMLVIGGIWFYFSGASEEQKRRAKAIVTSSVIGIVIILTAWLVVNTILVQTGLVDSDSWGAPWHEINCPIVD